MIHPEQAELREQQAREQAEREAPRLVVGSVSVDNFRGRPSVYTFSIMTDLVDPEMRFPEHLLDVALESTEKGLEALDRLSEERDAHMEGTMRGEPWARIWFDGETVVETRSWEALEDVQYWFTQGYKRELNP